MYDFVIIYDICSSLIILVLVSVFEKYLGPVQRVKQQAEFRLHCLNARMLDLQLGDQFLVLPALPPHLLQLVLVVGGDVIHGIDLASQVKFTAVTSCAGHTEIDGPASPECAGTAFMAARGQVCSQPLRRPCHQRGKLVPSRLYTGTSTLYHDRPRT